MVESGYEPNSLGSKTYTQHNQIIMSPVGPNGLFG